MALMEIVLLVDYLVNPCGQQKPPSYLSQLMGLQCNAHMSLLQWESTNFDS